MDKFIKIQGHKIRYQIHGTGPEAMLFVHGAVGSLNDFALQVDPKDGLDLNRFSLVVFDLPGHGLSEHEHENAKQELNLEYYQECADIGASLMAKLGFKTYSVAGWNDGARVASLIAVSQQSRVNSLLLWSFVSVMDSESSWALARTRDIGTWNKEALNFYTSVYGEEQFSEKWRKYVDSLVLMLEQPKFLVDVQPLLKQIKCPTLILHGSDDPIVNYKKQVEPLEMLIYDSNISQFKGSAHNLHQADPDHFNSVLTNFVSAIGVH